MADYWTQRLAYEKGREPGFNALSGQFGPNSAQAQAFATETNKGIAAMGPSPAGGDIPWYQKQARNMIPGAITPGAPKTRQAMGGIGGAPVSIVGQPTAAKPPVNVGLLPGDTEASANGLPFKGNALSAAVPTATVLPPGAPGAAPAGAPSPNFPTTWNQAGNPNLGGPGEGFTTPSGARFEASPLYQWQKMAAEKALNRQLSARGRSNSTFGMNALADMYNKLAAQEAETYYNRTFAQQQLGQQAAMEAARLAAGQQNALSSMYLGAGGNLASMAQQQGVSLAEQEWLRANPNMAVAIANGQLNSQMLASIGNVPEAILQRVRAIEAGRSMQPNTIYGTPTTVNAPFEPVPYMPAPIGGLS